MVMELKYFWSCIIFFFLFVFSILEVGAAEKITKKAADVLLSLFAL